MPPFRSGLLKRKSNLNTDKSESSKAASDDESDSSTEEGDLLKGELNVEGDDTDSEGEKSDVDSDQEQDEVLFGDEDSTLGDDEEGAVGDSESSELTDSEDDDKEEEASDNEGSEANSDSEEESEANRASGEEDSKVKGDSDTESGIGHTHSSSSESDKRQANTRATRKKQHKKTQDTDAVDRLTDTINKANITTQPVAHKDEYESGDTSDEEDRRNTVGDVPMWWYRDYPHLGYDLDARRILRPPQRDQIDDFLKKCEDPDFWRTVKDPTTGQDVILSRAELELLARLRAGRAPSAEGEQREYAPWVDWFTRDVLATPLRAFPDHKRSFLPSRDEQRAVGKLVHALRMGWLKTRRQLAAERRARKERRFYDLWGSSAREDEDRARGIHRHIPAPRRALPGHAESYNPPPEYLLDEQEMKEWNALSETPWKRKYTFLPTRHASLRAVPAFERFTRERFLRCLDLYLAPRAIKMRLTIGPNELVPVLPSPRELRPFPTGEAVVYRGHGGAVRSCGFDASGQYAVSGSDDGTVRVWETASGRCLRTVPLGAPVTAVAWTPVAGLALLAAAAGARLVLLAPGAGVGAHRVAARTDALLEEPPPAHDAAVDARTAAAAAWERVAPEEWARGVRLAVTHFRPVKHVAWHARGDYLAVTLHDAAARSVVVHQVSRRRSQLPFSRAKGLVQCAVFHPARPLLYVATQRAVRVYDLVKQELVRKLRTGAQWVSSVAVHPAGDNLLVGSYDRKLVWFDLELSSSPYRTLRLHGGAVRAVAYSARYPLFASCGDDGSAVVCHGAVFADLLQNPLLVPLRRLPVPKRGDVAGLHLVFHPAQPWLLVAAADHTLRLYT